MGKEPPREGTAPAPASEPAFDAEGRRTDGGWLSYSDYVNVRGLLEAARIPRDLPKGRARGEWPAWPETWKPGDPWPAAWPHDEHLFIVTHQTFELWFKQILHDLDALLASAGEVARARGVTIPRAHEVSGGDLKNLTSASLRLFPRLSKAAEALGEDERRWLLEMPIPGHGRTPARQWRTSWVEPGRLARWTSLLARSTKVLLHATGGFDLVATMTPDAFLEFRGRLVPASGFGSVQFREIEVVSGLGEARETMSRPPHGEPIPGLSMSAPSKATPREDADLALARHVPREELARVDRRLRAPSLRDLVAALLDAPELSF